MRYGSLSLRHVLEDIRVVLDLPNFVPIHARLEKDGRSSQIFMIVTMTCKLSVFLAHQAIIKDLCFLHLQLQFTLIFPSIKLCTQATIEVGIRLPKFSHWGE